MRISFFILLFFAGCISFAQGVKYRCKVYSVVDGLSQSSVYSVFQDSQGFIWAGTADGLNRFDGYSFKVFRHTFSNESSPPDNNIRQINEINDSLLIFSTDLGYCIYNRRNGNFNTNPYETPQPKKLYSKKIFIKDKTVWIYYNYSNVLRKFDTENDADILEKKLSPVNGEYYYRFLDPSQCKEFGNIVHNHDKELTDAINEIKQKIHVKTIDFYSLNSVLIDNYKSIWLATKYGLFVYKNKKLFNCSILNRGKVTPFNHFTEALCKDQNGNIWAGTSLNGLYESIEGREIFSKVEPENKSPNLLDGIQALLVDKSGMIWAGTDNGTGLVEINPNKPKFKMLKFSEINSGENTFIRGIAEDNKGNIWIGTNKKGLIKFNPKNLTYRFYKHHGENSIGSNDIYSVFYDHDKAIWIGSHKSLDRFDYRKNKFTHYNLIDVKSITEDSDSIIWAASMDGLFKGEKNKGGKYEFKNIDLNSVNTILYTGSNILWEGRYSSGLIKLNTKTNQFKNYTFNPNNFFSISNDRVQIIFKDPNDSNILWVGTQDGLNKFNIKEEKFYHYTENDELPSNFIYGILNDDNGNLWISTNKGLTKFNPGTKKFRNYSLNDGLQSYEFNSGAYLKTRDGKMLFGGINGLNLFYPDSVLDNTSIPNIVLTDIKKFDQPVKTSIDFSLVNEVKLNYDESVFSFVFSALEFTDPSQNNYAYQLKGFDENWIFNGKKHEARYTNLNPGMYTFLVKGTNNDGVWATKPLTVKVIIEPPFWQTWWFRTITAMLGLSLFVAGFGFIFSRNYRKKLKALKEQQAILNEKSRISRDMHDEVGAALTKISILSAMNPDQYKSMNGNQIKSINKAANEAINKLDEIVWAVNPSNDNLKNLIAYISEYAENFFESSQVHCRFDFPITVPEINISSEVRHEVFLVIKEILTNIQRYSEAKFALIKLNLDKERIRFDIKDDGKGFDAVKVMETSNGIKNMKYRIKSIGGEIKIESAPGNGTQIMICFYPC